MRLEPVGALPCQSFRAVPLTVTYGSLQPGSTTIRIEPYGQRMARYGSIITIRPDSGPWFITGDACHMLAIWRLH